MNEAVKESFVGIDVSKATLDLCIDHPLKTFQMTYDEKGIARILECLHETPPTLIVLEATGGLEVRVATELVSQGFQVAVINPGQARNFAKASGQLAKTDRVDAAVLAGFARAMRAQARPLKDADTRALDELIQRRRQLIDMRVQEMLRLGTAASKGTQKSLKQHIAWLEKRIVETDGDLNRRSSAPRQGGQGCIAERAVC
ncbi:MAG: transposase [Zoogloeaceae bacterium]|nr:transposase [Zoogloeaceae bacterium]